MQTLGVIGGSGLYDLPGLQKVRAVAVKTPFGAPSDPLLTGELAGARLVFVPRHGKGHRKLPTEVNVRANLWALKKLGCTRVLSVSAVGSMREEIAPGHLVVPDQFIDLTRKRESTFFGEGLVGHVGFADPICASLAQAVTRAAPAGAELHRGGTYLCIEGPQFSTRAESNLYRSWGVSVIGMTAATEAKLAREAELCYATLALATDYDCWHQGHAAVTVAEVMATMNANVEKARATIATLAAALAGAERTCACGQALESAIMTAPEAVPAATRKRLELLVGHRLPAPAKATRKPARKARR